MISRATLTTLAAAGLVMLLPVAASATNCPLDSFGARKVGTCRDASCLFFTPPPEIAAIKRGVYSQFVGIFINDGLAEWIGVDLDAGEIVRVERYAGPRLGDAPQVAQASPQLSRRETNVNGKRRIDIIGRAPLPRETAEDMVCAANAVWIDEAHPPGGSSSDVDEGVVLVDGATLRAEGGPSGMTKAVKALYDRLGALRERLPRVEVPVPR